MPASLRRVLDRWRAWRTQARLEDLGVLLWFVAVFVALLWAEGLRPTVFLTPDEAVNRFASELISKTGRPFLKLPFADPEDLAHPRSWLALGDSAIPVYGPVTFYLYALLTRLGLPGFVLITALPAGAVAAFVAGTARLLDERRRWLALAAPLLGMPALYWVMRPWMNISPMLVCVCWAFYFWTRFRQDGGQRSLALACGFVGFAAGLRVDYAAYLLPVALLFTVGARPEAWKRVALWIFAAGVGAVAMNLPLNHAITGHAFRPAYQLAFERGDGVDDNTPPALRILRALLFPLGLPSVSAAFLLIDKYWIKLPPLLFLFVGQIALVPLLSQQPRARRWLTLGALAGILAFTLARMDPTTFGAARSQSFVNDSVPRYWTPVYLLATLPPLLFIQRLRGKLLVAATLVLGLAALVGAEQLVRGSPHSLIKGRATLAEEAGRLERITLLVPKAAMIYSTTYDKVLWSRFLVGFVDEPEPTAGSLARAVEHHIPTYVWTQPKYRGFRALERACRKRHLALVEIDEGLHLYRVDARDPAPA